jgi:predicted transglutaminase-like cysteine proteinase
MGSFVNKIKAYRLGDLLVTGGIITQQQLDQALEEQGRTSDQLGNILIRQGALSAVQLARQLAQQWCIRTCALGIALVVQAGAPTLARADDTGVTNVSAHFRVASAVAPEAFRQRSDAARPELFGSREIRSDDISSFGKWTAMFARFAAPLHSSAAEGPGIDAWRAEIQSLKGLPAREQLRRINDFLNNIPYVDDRQVYGEAGYWGASPERFFKGGGDCKDYAIAKYVSLRALGFSSEQLRIAVVRDKMKNIPHAILIVSEKADVFVLDNQDRKIEFVSDVHRYQPIFSINGTSWWLQRA